MPNENAPRLPGSMHQIDQAWREVEGAPGQPPPAGLWQGAGPTYLTCRGQGVTQHPSSQAAGGLEHAPGKEGCVGE